MDAASDGPRCGAGEPATRLVPAGGRDSGQTDALLGQGRVALRDGRWHDAAEALGEVASRPLAASVVAEAAAGCSEALWWLGHVDDALAARARAYEAWRAAGDDGAAAWAACWLAREYAAAVGNLVASQGWLARAQTLAAADAAAAGWVALTRAVLTPDPVEGAAHANAALEGARAAGDGDLEVLALGRLGLVTIVTGEVEAGLRCFDEAMAAATGGEAGLSTLAALCCDLVVASEVSGEVERFAQWNEVVEGLAVRRGHPPLVAFCATCCAEAFSVAGDWQGAEAQLRSVLQALGATGHRARCLAPAAKLAELLVSQGRLEEAEDILGTDSEEGTLVQARLALARGEAATAAVLAERHARRLGGDSLLAVPALALAVDAYLAADHATAAQAAADRLGRLARRSGHRRTAGRASLARARIAARGGDTATATRLVEQALDDLSAVAPGAVETAEAHLELARLQAVDAPRLAVAEAKAAVAGFEAVGATAALNEAAALLRRLGDRSRVGAKDVGVLTTREQEVLRLVAQGLTNAEIAARLYISTKTAGNHVSNILAKLGLRSRVEAAAYAVLHAGD